MLQKLRVAEEKKKAMSADAKLIQFVRRLEIVPGPPTSDDDFSGFGLHEPASDQWIWKDGAGGYEETLQKMRVADEEMGAEEGMVQFVRCLGVSPGPASSWEKFAADPWYGEVTKFLATNQCGDGPFDRHAVQRMVTKAKRYELRDGVLWFRGRHGKQRCLVRGEIGGALREAHDEDGHFGVDVTRRKLSKSVFWPKIGSDVVNSKNPGLPLRPSSPAQF